MRILYFLLVIFLLMPLAANAQSGKDFDSMMADAYGSFRSAFWYTRTGNTGVAAMEMMMFDAKWSQLRKEYQNAPPPDYAKDPEWWDTLESVTRINSAAMELANKGQSKEAHAVISQIRDKLAAMRKRNGITAFSDYVNAYLAHIEEISPLRIWEYELSEDDWKFMETKAVEMQGAVEDMADNAPPALKADTEFQKSLNDNRKALARFINHLGTRHERGAKGTIREIRSDFGLLFLKYG